METNKWTGTYTSIIVVILFGVISLRGDMVMKALVVLTASISIC